MLNPMSQAARLDVMDEVLLADRFAAALAAAPAVSCAVPLPPTMPAVKISANGLPMPVRLESEAPLFKRMDKVALARMVRPAGAGAGIGGRKLLNNDDMKADQAKELSDLSADVLELTREYNKCRDEAGEKEEQLELLQVRALLGSRDVLDADEELKYMRALRAASEAELERTDEQTTEEEHASVQFGFMARRLVLECAALKKHVSDFKEAMQETERKLASALSRSSELMNGAKEAARQYGILRTHVERQRAQDAAVLEKAREQAHDAATMQEWTREQMRASHERVQEQARRKVQKTETAKLSAAEQLGRWRACSRETKLEEGFERLQASLGCRSVEEVVAKIERDAAQLGSEHQRGSASLVFELMVASKTQAEEGVMKLVNEVTRQETVLSRLRESDSSALGEIIDHKQKLHEVDEKLRKQSSRGEQARVQAGRADGRVHEVHIGTQRLVQMLSHVPLSKAVSDAPPSLTIRRGAEQERGARDEGSDDDDDDAASRAPAAANARVVTLTSKAGAAPPPKDSAAAVVTSALPNVKELAALEDAFPSAASCCVESAVGALHNLAAIEHRLGILLPEIQRSDARTRMRQASTRQLQMDARHRQSDASASLMVARVAAGATERQASLERDLDGAVVGAGGRPPTPGHRQAPPPPVLEAGGGGSSSSVFLTQSPSGLHAADAADAADTGATPASATAAPAADGAKPPSTPFAAAQTPVRRQGGASDGVMTGSFSRGRSTAGAGPSSAAVPRRPSSAFGGRAKSSAKAEAKVRPVGELSSMPSLLAQLHVKAAHENNVRVDLSDSGLDGGSPGFGGRQTEEASERDKTFLWRVFQAFDQNHSGNISLLEVRALFDRVALEQSLDARGEGGSSDRMLRAASKFVTSLFDENGDGKLGKSELDQFFHVFNSDDSKQISWDEFLLHGSRMLRTQREVRAGRDRLPSPCRS